jgi:hypothetical protein
MQIFVLVCLALVLGCDAFLVGTKKFVSSVSRRGVTALNNNSPTTNNAPKKKKNVSVQQNSPTTNANVSIQQSIQTAQGVSDLILKVVREDSKVNMNTIKSLTGSIRAEIEGLREEISELNEEIVKSRRVSSLQNAMMIIRSDRNLYGYFGSKSGQEIATEIIGAWMEGYVVRVSIYGEKNVDAIKKMMTRVTGSKTRVDTISTGALCYFYE